MQSVAEQLGAPWLMQSSSQLPTPRLLPPSVLEVVTFVRWCGPVEPFPDAGRFDEPRGGGSPVTRGQREACEPFEGGRGHARFAEPAAQFQRFWYRAWAAAVSPSASWHRPNPASATPSRTGVPRSMNPSTAIA